MKKVCSLILILMILIIAGCQTQDDGKKDDLNPLVSLDIIQENQSLTIGETLQLSVIKNPTTNTDSLVWESLTPLVASVSTTGLVTGLSAGGTIIKVKNASGSIFDTVIITVTEEEQEVGVITWSGLETQNVVAGNDIDVKSFVKAIDSVDGDITKDIIVLNDIDHEEELKENGWYNDFIEFESNLTGVYFVYYMVENSTGVKEYKSKQFVVEQGYNVVNGNFTLKKSFWTLDAPGGTASWTVQNDGNAHISIANSGTEWWAVQLMQTVSLKLGKTYKMSIVAKSPQEKTISFAFEDPTNDFRMLMGGINVQRLGTEFTTYETYWTPDSNYASAKAVIYLGHMSDTDKLPSTTPDQVIIQRVKIEEVEAYAGVNLTVPSNLAYTIGSFTLDPNDTSGKPIFNPMTGVSATLDGKDITSQVQVFGLVTPNILARTDYLLNYVVKSEDKVSFHTRRITVTMERDVNWRIINDNFESWLAGWTVDMNQTNAPGSSANFNQVEDGLSIEMVKKGSANWHMQIFQVGVRFEQGKTYTIQIRIKGENLGANKVVAFELAANLGSGFTPYPNTSKNITLTGEYVLHEVTFTPTQNLNSARLGFQFGNVNVGTLITIDYFTIVGPAA